MSGFAIWLTGLPSSGKTTIARAMMTAYCTLGIETELLDSDELRPILTPNPTYLPEERDNFYAEIANIAAEMVRDGKNVLIAATAAKRAYRDAARALIPNFTEIYVSTPLDVCRARDPKQLYKRAAVGEIEMLPGVGTPYEPPLSPELILDTSGVDHCPTCIARQVVLTLTQPDHWDAGW